MERRRAHRFGSALLFIGLAVLLVTDWWWPGIAAVLAASMSLNSLLQGRLLRALVPLVVGASVVALTLVNAAHLWSYLGAAILLMVGISHLFRAAKFAS